MIYLAFWTGAGLLYFIHPDSRQSPAEQCKALPLIPRLSLYLGIERRRILLAWLRISDRADGLGHWVIDIDIKAFRQTYGNTQGLGILRFGLWRGQPSSVNH